MTTSTTKRRWVLGGLLAALGCDDGEGLVQLRAEIEVTPNPVLLPDTALGLTRRTPVRIASRGDLALTITELTLAGSDELTLESPNLPLVLDPGGETQVDVAYTPTQVQGVNGTLRIRSSAANAPDLEVPIQGQPRHGPALVLCAFSPSIGLTERCFEDQGVIDLGRTGVPSTLTATISLRNLGDEPAPVDGLALAARADPAFRMAALTTPTTLAPGERVDRTVTYAPTAPGEHQAKVAVQSNLTRLPSLELRAQATPKALCADPEGLDFGNSPVGTPKTASVRIYGCGPDPVTVLATNVEVGSPAFSVTPLNQPVTLPPDPNVGLTVTLTFRPEAPGVFEGGLWVESDAGRIRVGLRGSSETCALSAIPNRIVFSPGTTQRSFIVENSGAQACDVQAIGISTGSAPLFFLPNPPAVPRTLAPGASLTVEVGLNDSPTTQALGGVDLDYQGAGQAGRLHVDLEAADPTGAGPCTLEVTPSAITFGVVPRDTTVAQTLSIFNAGASPCRLSSVDLTPGSSLAFTFERFGNLELQPGELAAGVVRFRSSVVMAETGTLRIDPDDPSSLDIDVPISATTSGPLLCVHPARIDFGAVTSGSAVVDLVACGSAAVTISALEIQPTAPEFSLSAAPTLPFSIPAGDTVSVPVAYNPADGVGDVAELVIGSNDPNQPQQRVLLTGGPNVPELCGNGLDEDGDQFIDEDCVPGPAIGRAVVWGQGRLFVWGDEHVKLQSYGARPAAFWRGVFRWLTCEGRPGPRRTRVGDLNAYLNPLMQAEASALGIQVVNASSADFSQVDAVLVVANYGGVDVAALDAWVQAGGSLMLMAVGLGSPDECTDTLDPVTAPFPLHYDCSDPVPWGPVGRFYPHPISQGLAPEVAPFLNGRYVSELPGTHSTVIAVP